MRRKVTMRRKIGLLVAATTSAVIIAFLIPLAMLVRTLAEDRAIAGASQEAQGVATLVAGVKDESQLVNLVNLVDQESTRATSALMPDGTLIGTPPPAAALNAGVISRARAGEAFILLGDQNAQVVVPDRQSTGAIPNKGSVSSVYPSGAIRRPLIDAYSAIDRSLCLH